MGIGLGILLCVAGLVLGLDVVTVDVPYINDNLLGWILLGAGVVAIALTMMTTTFARRSAVRVERHETVPPSQETGGGTGADPQ